MRREHRARTRAARQREQVQPKAQSAVLCSLAPATESEKGATRSKHRRLLSDPARNRGKGSSSARWAGVAVEGMFHSGCVPRAIVPRRRDS